MPLILPNDFLNATPADAAPLQQNFTVIENHVNSEVIARDGSVAMTNALLLPGPPTQPNQAATKAYADGLIAGHATDVELAAVLAVANEAKAMRPKLLPGTAVNGGSLTGVVYLGSIFLPVDSVYVRTWIVSWDIQAANATVDGIVEFRWANGAGTIVSPAWTLGLLAGKWTSISSTFAFVSPAGTSTEVRAMANVQSGVTVNVASWVYGTGYVE